MPHRWLCEPMLLIADAHRSYAEAQLLQRTRSPAALAQFNYSCNKYTRYVRCSDTSQVGTTKCMLSQSSRILCDVGFLDLCYMGCCTVYRIALTLWTGRTAHILLHWPWHCAGIAKLWMFLKFLDTEAWQSADGASWDEVKQCYVCCIACTFNFDVYQSKITKKFYCS